MHATTGNWRRGFALALTTAVCWGILPIALKHLLNGMDAITVTWYRLTTAGLALAVYLTWRRKSADAACVAQPRGSTLRHRHRRAGRQLRALPVRARPHDADRGADHRPGLAALPPRRRSARLRQSGCPPLQWLGMARPGRGARDLLSRPAGRARLVQFAARARRRDDDRRVDGLGHLRARPETAADALRLGAGAAHDLSRLDPAARAVVARLAARRNSTWRSSPCWRSVASTLSSPMAASPRRSTTGRCRG